MEAGSEMDRGNGFKGGREKIIRFRVKGKRSRNRERDAKRLDRNR